MFDPRTFDFKGFSELVLAFVHMPNLHVNSICIIFMVC